MNCAKLSFSPQWGECVGDRLTVTASGLSTRSVPILCGNNRNQHCKLAKVCNQINQFSSVVYVHLPRDGQDRSASLLFMTNSAGPFRWHIRVTQVDCTRTGYSSYDRNQLNTEGNYLSS